jgi:hypothetical protein
MGRNERERLARALLRAERAYRAAQAAISSDRGSDSDRRAYAHARAALLSLEEEAARACRLPLSDEEQVARGPLRHDPAVELEPGQDAARNSSARLGERLHNTSSND